MFDEGLFPLNKSFMGCTVSYNELFDKDKSKAFCLCETLDELIKGMVKPECFPHIEIYHPTHAQFEMFDIIVASYDEKGNQPQTDYTCIELNSSTDTGVGAAEYCFGEQPVSLRTALKRYVTTFNNRQTLGVTVHTTLAATRNILPIADPVYSLSTSNTVPTLIHYLAYAYLGMRGGIRKRIRLMNTGVKDFMANSSALVSLVPVGGSLTTTNHCW